MFDYEAWEDKRTLLSAVLQVLNTQAPFRHVWQRPAVLCCPALACLPPLLPWQAGCCAAALLRCWWYLQA